MENTSRYVIRYMKGSYQNFCPTYIDAVDFHDAICKFNEIYKNLEIISIAKFGIFDQ